MNKPTYPPKLPLRFFRWFCHPDYVEDIEGDLLERFEKRRQEGRAVRWLFALDVLRLFRPGIIRSIEGTQKLNYYGMLRHYLIISFRNSFRHKSAFLINLLGLSSGLASVLFIYLWVSDELQVDKFHEKDKRLYQVMLNDPNGNTITTSPFTPHLLAGALVDEMAEVENAVAVIPAKLCADYFGPFKVATKGHVKIEAKGQFAEEPFFQLFSYELIEGNASDALSAPKSVAISENLARKLFRSTQNAIGKTFNWQLAGFSGQALVTAVFNDVPAQSTAQFDFVLDFHTWYELLKQLGMDPLNWGNHTPSTYVVLGEGVSQSTFQSRTRQFLKSKSKISDMDLLAVPYSSQHLYGKFENGQQVESRIKYVRLFSVVAGQVLLIACINFMNLSTARASRRMKEVGIKKTMGSSRKSLAAQFLLESLMMVFLSSVAAFLLVLLLLPQFDQLTGKHLTLTFDLKSALLFFGAVCFTGILAGSYPAFYLSGFKPVSVLKGKLDVSFGEMWVRKGLVIFQFVIVIVLIATVLVVYKQVDFIQTKNLGYNKEDIIYFHKEGEVAEKFETFVSELKHIPGVINASSMSGNLSGMFSSTGDFSWDGKDPGLEIDFAQLYSSYDLLETLGMELLEGRSFSKAYNESRNLIFNETAIAVMGLNDPVGKTVKLWGNDRKIIGVIKDFHFESLHESVKPLAISLEPSEAFRVLVKLNAEKQKKTLAAIEDLYADFNPGFSFDFKFLDSDYQALYVSEKRISVLARLFACLAVIISCLGLLGLVAFTIERRTKEIGIRKTLGLSEFGIMCLISFDFIKLVLIAVIIAWPVSYLLARRWLEQFAYRIEIQWWFFAVSGLVAIVVAWVVASWQALKITWTNPAECLRDE